MLTENKNILALCTTAYFNDRGCHVRILQVLQHLSHSNNVIVNAYSTGRNIDGQRIERIKKIFPDEKDYIGFNPRKMILDFHLFMLAAKTIKNEKIDGVLCFTHEAGILGFFLKHMFKIKYWLDFQGSLSKEMMNYSPAFSIPFVTGFFKFVEDSIEKASEAVIFNTGFSYDASSVKNKILLKDSSDVFAVDSPRKETCNDNSYRILWVGIAADVQGFEEFMNISERILEKRDNVKIFIASFPVSAKTKKRFDRFKGRMNFLGRVDFDKLPEMVSDSDLCISTKKESSEGNSKLHLYKKYARDILALETRASLEIIEKRFIVKSYEEMEKEIIERINNADSIAT